MEIRRLHEITRTLDQIAQQSGGAPRLRVQVGMAEYTAAEGVETVTGPFPIGPRQYMSFEKRWSPRPIEPGQWEHQAVLELVYQRPATIEDLLPMAGPSLAEQLAAEAMTREETP